VTGSVIKREKGLTGWLETERREGSAR